MRNDRDRQQGRGGKGMTAIIPARGNDQRQRPEYASEHDRSQHDPGRPDDARRKFQRHHAGVVHRRDANADHRAASRNRRPAVIEQRNAEADDGDRYSKDQRHEGDRNVVSGTDAGIVSQHRDEVGGPNSAAADRRIQPDPDRARAAL